MKFTIEDKAMKRRRVKKADQKRLVYISLFFFVLALFIVIIYLISTRRTTSTTPVSTKKVEQTEQKTINIVNEKSNERPIAVMIDNNIGDAKHAGLQDSFVNYEIIVEGGLSRIMAIYKDKNTELIGPVRSARHYFLDYALEYDAVYVHYGWSPLAEENINSLNVQNINGMTDPTPFARDPNLASPHNVFTTMNKIKSYIETNSYNNTSSNWKALHYSADEINLEKIQTNELIDAKEVTVNYSDNEKRSYTYDSENSYYLRNTNGNPHIDRLTNNQLHFKNIIIMKVPNKALDSEGRQDLETVGNGVGYYATNGYAKKITWSKSSRTSKTTYSYEDGSEVVLNDGNTFIQIVPTTSGVTIG